MKESPILFSTPMVQAILEDRKTQTRRVIKPQPTHHYDEHCPAPGYFDMGGNQWACRACGGEVAPLTGESRMSAPYQPGDILWVRETWSFWPCWDCDNDCNSRILWHGNNEGCFVYRAQKRKVPHEDKWKPSIHMPKDAARLRLEALDVYPERLRDITNEDAIAEGIFEVRPGGWLWEDPAKTHMPNMTLAHTPRQAFMWLWERINAKRGFGWASNPWVWVVKFRRVNHA